MPEQLVSLIVKHRYTASPERVYDAWLDPTKASKWLFSTPTGTMVKVEIDARVGGKFNFTDRRDGVDVEHIGEYVELDRPRRLAFTFGVPLYTDMVTKVIVDIAPVDGGGCEVTLTHEGVLAEYNDRTRDGWTMMLTGLERALA